MKIKSKKLFLNLITFMLSVVFAKLSIAKQLKNCCSIVRKVEKLELTQAFQKDY